MGKSGIGSSSCVPKLIWSNLGLFVFGRDIYGLTGIEVPISIDPFTCKYNAIDDSAPPIADKLRLVAYRFPFHWIAVTRQQELLVCPAGTETHYLILLGLVDPSPPFDQVFHSAVAENLKSSEMVSESLAGGTPFVSTASTAPSSQA